MRCAHVGWTGSTADAWRLVILAGWTHDHPLPGAAATPATVDVKFDLVYEGGPDPRYGADFLTDRRQFEIVVLHHLFAGWSEGERIPTIGTHLAFSCSPKHSPAAWRRRLRATKARRIVAFGGAFEVASTYLAAIRGYRKIDTPFGAVFDAIATTP